MAALNGLSEFGLSKLWQASENYLKLGSQTNTVVSVRDKTIVVSSTSHKTPLILTILKIVSYITLILPLIALILCRLYRKHYTIENIKTVAQLPAVKPFVTQSDPAPTVQSFEDDYKLSKVIAKIDESRKQGLKIGVYVGRKDTQSLPSEKGWLWVSLDIEMEQTPSAQRLHLKMDFNDPAALEQIQCLFDKVVLDASVIKFIHKPWTTLHRLLVLKPESELIADAYKSAFINPRIQAPEFYPEKGEMHIPQIDEVKFGADQVQAFKIWAFNVGKTQEEALYQAFLIDRKLDHNSFSRDLFRIHILKKENLGPQRKTYVAELCKEIEKYLFEYFKEVSFFDAPYPYDIHENSKENRRFWICRSPKTV